MVKCFWYNNKEFKVDCFIELKEIWVNELKYIDKYCELNNVL